MNDTRYVLDGTGYVRIRDHMGSDLSVVNAARVSFDKQATWKRAHQGRLELHNRDQKLLNFLARHNHKSPFAHAFLQFEVYAPLIIVRQWFKHRVGSTYQDMPVSDTESWNESSRRYVTENNEFYIPKTWRTAPENRKQGSGPPASMYLSEKYTTSLLDVIDMGNTLYEQAINDGIAPEQARLMLPYGALYVRFMWSCSLLRVLEYLDLRDAEDAQSEITEYAQAIRALVQPLYPAVFTAWDQRKQ